MDVASQLPGVALEKLRECRLGDQLRGAGTDDMGTQEPPALRVGHHLHEAGSLAVDLRAAESCERKLAELDLMALFACLLFGQADRGDLRVRVGAAGDELLLHRSQRLARAALRGDD